MIDLIKIRRELHQIPELGFQEYQTSDYIIKKICNYHCQVIQINTGVIAFFDNHKEQTLAYRCEMDALPIIEKNKVIYASKNNNMHACAHDGHMAIAIGVIDYLNNHYSEYEHNFAIIFQPSEEIYGGSKTIIDSNILFKLKIKNIIAIHFFPKLRKNQFYTNLIPFSSSNEINFLIKGKSVHVGNRNNGRNSILASSELIKKLESLNDDNTIVHIGMIEGGEARNIVASSCIMKGTIREIKSTPIIFKIESIIDQVKKKYQVEIQLDTKNYLPSIKNNEHLIKQAKELINLEILNFTFFQSEDFSMYSNILPSLYLLYGIGEENYLHSDNFNFDESILNKCLKQVIKLLKIN